MDSKSPRSAEAFSMEDFEKALEQHDYQFKKGQVVQGRPYSYESDGVLVDIGGKSPAFMPSEEASLRRIADLSAIVPLQEEREFLIIRDQDAEGQVTLSIRQLELRRAWKRMAEMQDSGQSFQVKVTGTNKGGVTVDVQGLRGFIPRSHLVERDNLEGLVGTTLTANLLEVNPAQKKLVLSNRLATRSASFSQLEVGQLVEGKVSSIKPFGIFVELSGVSGLLHINQISKNYIESLAGVFQVGQPLKAMIVDLDEGRGRVSLSTKVLESYPGEMLENQETVMKEAEDRQNRARKTVLEG